SLRIKPDNVPTLLNLARVEEQRGRLPEAEERLRAARKVDPRDATVLVNLATIHTKLGRSAEAVAEYEEAMKLPGGDDAVSRNGYGVALMGLGRVGDALEQFEESLRQDPGYGGARANLERALAIAKAPPRKP